MCYRYLHVFLRPAERAEESFDPQLANGLQAEPFRTDFAGIGMLQRVNVYAAAGLCLTLPDGVGNDVKALPLYHHRPVLLYLLTYDIAIDCHLIFP